MNHPDCKSPRIRSKGARLVYAERLAAQLELWQVVLLGLAGAAVIEAVLLLNRTAVGPSEVIRLFAAAGVLTGLVAMGRFFASNSASPEAGKRRFGAVRTRRLKARVKPWQVTLLYLAGLAVTQASTSLSPGLAETAVAVGVCAVAGALWLAA